MIVSKAELRATAVREDQYPPENMPEIALIGRSNVGKSSLINNMLQRKGLARTSSSPGKTQTLNFYEINETFRFVDLPGYGYARVSKVQRADWAAMIENYLFHRGPLKLLLLLTDARHGPSDEDLQMYDWVLHHDLPCCIVGTKADKVKKSIWMKRKKEIIEAYGLPSEQQLNWFSSQTSLGKKQLWSLIEQVISDNDDILRNHENE